MAARFDAATDAYRATTGLPTGGTYTVTCWANLLVDRDDYSGVWGLDDGVASGLWLQTDSDGTTLGVFDTPAATHLGATAVTVGTWYRVAVVVNGTSVTTHIGAAGAALTTSTATLAPLSSPSRLAIGDEGFSGWLNGRVAAFKLWGAALSADEAALELEQYTPRRAANLLRWHPFVAAETVDYSGNGNALTAGGTGTTTEDGPPIPWADLPPVTVFA